MIKVHGVYVSLPSIEQLEEQEIENQQVEMQPPALDFEKIFDHSYDYQPLVEINAKQSVSQRKEEETTPMFKGIPEVKPQVAYDRPSFMKEQQVSRPEDFGNCTTSIHATLADKSRSYA